MATATVARPGQALRQRRDGQRPSITKRSMFSMDDPEQPAHKKAKLNEPYVRDSDYILKKHKGKAPSLIVHLHPTHFRFDGQDGSFSYDSPMKFIITHLKNQTVPHEMLEELLGENVPFYDGCLIVEVHNHRETGKSDKSKGPSDSAAGKDTTRYSMHAYNEHIIPSPLVPYPSKAKGENAPEKPAEGANGEMGAPARPGSKGSDTVKSGPKIATLVLHPTALTRHHELLILARTPATDVRSKKKGSDATTPLNGQPPTPSLSVPPTPLTARGQTTPQKMCLEETDFYSFQSDLLVATGAPLYLDPAGTPQEAEQIMQLLSDPLHANKPPSPKTRKRTTAEMAADDAQAAETERRMLIMDERIKPSARNGAGASNENQNVAAAFGFSRFKTLEMVRQRHEEQERTKKEEEERAAALRRQNEEQAQQKAILTANKQRELQQQQQRQGGLLMAQRQEQIRIQQEAQRQQAALAASREHGHQQQNGMMQGQQGGNFPHQNGSMAQSSPVVRQQTPNMMNNSSPMMQNGGFPMAQNPSQQGAGSPSRPGSAAMQNRNVAMARQISQQHSQGGTPQNPQGTPNMAPAMPRQMSQTPRMAPGSPAVGMQGTPTPNMMGMGTPQIGNQQSQLRPEQIAMLQHQAALQNQQNGGNGQGNSPGHGVTPEQIANIRMQQQQARNQAMLQAQQAAANGGNPNAAAQAAYRQHMMRQAAQQQFIRMQAQNAANGGQAGSPPSNNMQLGGQQGTPQMGHAHPQQNGMNQMGMPNNGNMTPQQEHAFAQQKAQALQLQRQSQVQLTNLSNQYGGFSNIPPSVVNTLTPNAQNLLKQQLNKQNMLRMRQQAMAQANGNGGGGNNQTGNGTGTGENQVTGQPNPQYMQALRNNQTMLMQMQQQNGGGGNNGGGAGSPGMGNMGNNNMNMNGMGNMGNMNNMGQGNGQFNGNGQNNNMLNQHFENMQNALNQRQNGMGGGQQ